VDLIFIQIHMFIRISCLEPKLKEKKKQGHSVTDRYNIKIMY